MIRAEKLIERCTQLKGNPSNVVDQAEQVLLAMQKREREELKRQAVERLGRELHGTE